MNKLRNFGLSLVLLLSAIAPSCPRVAFAQQSTTVISGLGPGLGQSVNPFDSSVQTQQKIAALVQQAANANAAAKAAYLQKAQDWLTDAVHDRDLNMPIPPVPAPPQAQHVDPNTGVMTLGPDLVAQAPVLPAPIQNNGSNGAIASSTPAPDRIDQIMSGLGQMWTLLQNLSSQVASCSAK